MKTENAFLQLKSLVSHPQGWKIPLLLSIFQKMLQDQEDEKTIYKKKGALVIGRDWDKNIHVFVFGISKATDLLRAGFFSFVAFNLSKQEEEGNNVLLWRISAVQAKSFHK